MSDQYSPYKRPTPQRSLVEKLKRKINVDFPSEDKNLKKEKQATPKKNNVELSHPETSNINERQGSSKDTENQPQTSNKRRSPKKKSKNKNLNEEINLDSDDSVQDGRKHFKWIIKPIPVDDFFETHWERRPILLQRHSQKYYENLITSEKIEFVLHKNALTYETDIKLLKYSFEKVETFSASGRVYASVVFDLFKNNHSIVFVNPERLFIGINILSTKLQEYFGCRIETQIHVTPPACQAIELHYAGAECFVLQIEGGLYWNLYNLQYESDQLPRKDGGICSEDDVGEPIMSEIMEAGDLMYIPRGIKHQAINIEETNSIHIVIYVYRNNSWADLLEKLLPSALKVAVEKDVSFRKGLPMHYLSHTGLVHSDTISSERSRFKEMLQKLLVTLFSYAPVDTAVDEMGKQFLANSLPPYVPKKELNRTVLRDAGKINDANPNIPTDIKLTTKVKLLRYNAIRLIMEEGTIRLYYSTSNSLNCSTKQYHYLEIRETVAPAIDALVKYYPMYLAVEELPLENNDDKLDIIRKMWTSGLIITELDTSHGL